MKVTQRTQLGGKWLYFTTKDVDYVDKAEQCSFLDIIPQEPITDKPRKTRRKQIEINVDGALVERNLLLLPLAPIGAERNVGTIIVTWTDSQNNLRGIKVSVTDEFGMLTRFDINVLNAIMKLYSIQNKVIPFDFEKKKYKMPREVKYTLSGLARILKYPNAGGTIKNKIKYSIRKLANCTITSLHKGGLWDADNGCYLEGTSEAGFHIIETYSMHTLDKPSLNPHKVSDYNKIVINDFFYRGMCSGNTKIIDFNQLIDIKGEVAQRIFSLLEGWYCNKRPYIYINYKTLYERIPLNPVAENEVPMETKVKNRYIKRACEELLDKGYLVAYITVKMKGVYFVFDSDIENPTVDDLRSNYFGYQKYNTIQEVITALVNYKVDSNIIDKYVKDVKLDYYGALLRSYDVNVRNDNIIGDSPVGWLIAGLMRDYNLNDKYYNKKEIESSEISS